MTSAMGQTYLEVTSAVSILKYTTTFAFHVHKLTILYFITPACKPYLIFAIEECVRTAQRGGVGVVVYFRKEGRALGEVTKYVIRIIGPGA